jgi:hypothetical protein
MVFDIEVQNGGIYSNDYSDYSNWLKQNPSSLEADRLNEILSLRVRHVRPQYVTDVIARKTTIINGSGFVHSENRNLEREYCYDGQIPLSN